MIDKKGDARDWYDWSLPKTFSAIENWSCPDTNSYSPRKKTSSPLSFPP